MNHKHRDVERCVILADETADWKIGGLPQLERLTLALNEFAAATGRTSQIQAFVFWKGETGEGWLPDSTRFCRVRSIKSCSTLPPGWFIVSTRLFVGRDGFSEFFDSGAAQILSEPTDKSPESWERLADRFNRNERIEAAAGERRRWRLLRTRSDCSIAEKDLVGGAGKSQDGMASRFLNRPISRLITRQLLKFPITPTAWTLSIFVFPVLSFLFLCRGDYAGFLVGTVLYHIHSILDGCDGEIARAKYLESKRGCRIDDFCDMFGNFLFVIGLGLGLWSQSSSARGWLYAAEGFLCAAVMAANEWLLRHSKAEAEVESKVLSQALYPRHRQLVQRAGLAFLGERPVWLFVQITKRDVGILFFVLLALLGQARWILHLSFLGPAVTLLLSIGARFGATRRDSVSVGAD